MRGRVLVIVAGVAALALAGVLALGLARGVGDSPLGEVDAGFEAAADFTLPTFDGGTFALSEYTDAPLFIYFWASWCAPCFREAPLIERLWPEFEAAGYTFVGVNILDSEGDAREFIERFDLSFPLVANLDSEEDVRTFVEQFDLSLPRVMDSRDLSGLWRLRSAGGVFHPARVAGQSKVHRRTDGIGLSRDAYGAR